MKDPANRKTKKEYQTADIATKDIGQTVESMRLLAYNHRRIFERRWYDNNFFDDGFHFRYLSRTTNKIVDLSERATVYTPQRAIPKASRQIRGVANLLISQDPTPAVYPEEIDASKYPQSQDPSQPGPYEVAKKNADLIARKRGWWLEEKWREPDASGETMLEKLALMPILTAKHAISYMQIWADANTEEIRSQVYDAFDIYLLGNYTSIYDCPFIIKAIPMSIATIKANPAFDQDQLEKISPDNRLASSEIKQAYQSARFGGGVSSETEATLILKEAYIKEYLNEENIEKIKTQKNSDKVLKGKEMGDLIMRQVFVAGNVWLRDEYLAINEYPFVEFRMEPGPLYQVPLIERFIPANKSLDSAVSRLERYFHTMVTGMWMKRRGEQFKLSNVAGGQVVEYDGTPPVQANLASPGEWTFGFVNLLQSFIEEQGVSTTTLGKLPAGVKGHQAIESLKESEYANLIIATRRMKETVRKIAQKMFEIADENIIRPQTVSHTVRGKTEHFSVIGASALSKRKKLQIETNGEVVPLSRDSKINIEIESGMAYTKEGQKEAMQTLINTMLQWAQIPGVLSPASIKVLIDEYMEQYSFGSTAEFMQEYDKTLQGQPMDDIQAQKMKIALLEALKDAGEVGPEADQSHEQITKYAVLSALKDAGLIKHIQTAGNAATAPLAKPLTETLGITYKDLPEDVKRQVESQIGFTPSQTISPSGSDQIAKHNSAKQGNVQADRQHAIDIVQMAQQAQQAQADDQMQQQELDNPADGGQE